MAVVIPTLKQMKKDRVKTTYEYSVRGIIDNIHRGICAKFEYIDVPYMVHNQEDKELLDKIITNFNKKGHKLEKVAEVPEKKAGPQGQMVEYVAVRLRIHIEPLVFVEKKSEKKVVEKMIPQTRLDSIEESESAVKEIETKVKKEKKPKLKMARKITLKRKTKKKVIGKIVKNKRVKA